MQDRMHVFTVYRDSGPPPRESNPPVLIKSQNKKRGFAVSILKPKCPDRESNPGRLLGRQPCYHYTIGAKYTQKGSNLRPAVDKTAALPTETYGCSSSKIMRELLVRRAPPATNTTPPIVSKLFYPPHSQYAGAYLLRVLSSHPHASP